MRLVKIAAATWIAVRPPQLERVRGDLHRAGAVAAVEHLAERALEVDRLGRGADGRPLLAGDHRGHGPEQAGLAPGRLEQRADEERRRGLAVRPRDADYGQPARGVAVEARGGDRHRGADVVDLDLGHAEAERPGDDERRRPARDRVGREVVAVAGEAGDAEEQGPGLHGTVVVGEAADLDRRPIAEQLSDGHPRAVYERLRTLRSIAMPVEDDPDGAPPPRGGRERRSGASTRASATACRWPTCSTASPASAPRRPRARCVAELPGWRIAADEELGRAAAGGGRHEAAPRPPVLVRPPRRPAVGLGGAAGDPADRHRPPGRRSRRRAGRGLSARPSRRRVRARRPRGGAARLHHGGRVRAAVAGQRPRGRRRLLPWSARSSSAWCPAIRRATDRGSSTCSADPAAGRRARAAAAGAGAGDGRHARPGRHRGQRPPRAGSTRPGASSWCRPRVVVQL